MINFRDYLYAYIVLLLGSLAVLLTGGKWAVVFGTACDISIGYTVLMLVQSARASAQANRPRG